MKPATAKEDPETLRRYEKLAKISTCLQERKARLSEEEYHTVKSIFHVVPLLDTVPKALWQRVCQLLAVKEVQKGEKLVSLTDPKMMCYIILTGGFEVLGKEGENELDGGRQQFLPGSLCGDFQFLNGKHWRQTDVVATKEGSSAAVLPPDEMTRLIDLENSNLSYKTLIAFLTESIPRFDQLSGNLRERLGRLFVERTFVAGCEIMKEGSKVRTAYLIKEGRCNIISTENPLMHNNAQAEAQESVQLSTYLRTGDKGNSLGTKKVQKGYMSTSTTRYQLRTIGEREWFGEELLLEGEDEINNNSNAICYTVISAVKTVVLAISRESLHKFPRDVLEQMRRNAQEKLSWHVTRKRDLSQSIAKINEMSTLVDYFEQAEAGKQEQKNRRQAIIMASTKYIARPGRRGNPGNPYYSNDEPSPSRGSHRRGRTADPMASHRRDPSIPILPLEELGRPAESSIRYANNNDRSCYVSKSIQGNYKGGRGGMSSTYYQDGEQRSMLMFKSMSRFKGETEGSPDRYGPDRRLLEAASTFKALKNNKMLCPMFMYKPHGPRSLTLRARTSSHTGYNEKARENIRKKHDTFKVGVRDVKAIDPMVGKRPPSPNPVKIWAERNGIDISARNKLVRRKYAVQSEGNEGKVIQELEENIMDRS